MIPTFDDYAQKVQALGYEEVVVRAYTSGQVVETHRHPFAAKALVVSGEMWITMRGITQHLGVGDGFELDAEEPHAERYGDEGATYWVGRRAPIGGA